MIELKDSYIEVNYDTPDVTIDKANEKENCNEIIIDDGKNNKAISDDEKEDVNEELVKNNIDC